MLKRLFSLLIIAALCLNALPLSAWYEPAQFAPAQFAPAQFAPAQASTPAQPMWPTAYGPVGGEMPEPVEPEPTVIEPVLPEDGGELPLPYATNAYPDYPMFQNTDEAAAYMLEQMNMRNANFGYQIIANDPYSDSWSETVSALGAEVREKVFTHNINSPAGGDYLLKSYRGYDRCMLHMQYYYENGNYYISSYVVWYENMKYYTTPEQEAQVGPAIEKLISELDLRSSHKSTYDKIRAVYDWMVMNIEYDFYHQENDSDYPTQYSAYAGIVERCCVCQGFGTLFYRIMLTLGIECRYISGVVSAEGGRHGWNIVELYGQYFLCDTTWDSNGRTYADQGGYPYPGHSWCLLGKNSRFGERICDEDKQVLMDTLPVSQCSYEAHDAARTSGKLAPTCTEAGATGSGVCPDCGVTLENFAVPSLGHDYDESGNCSRCGKVKPAYPLGDLDFDSDVNVRDGVVMQRVLSGLEADAELLESADLNLDGDVTVIDGVIMQRILAGLQAE